MLVKKPEIPDEIVPPITPETKQHKPEVYFIKYQGDKDVQQKVLETENSASSDNVIAPQSAQSSDATNSNAVDASDARSSIESSSQLAGPSDEQPSEQLPVSSDAASNVPSIQELPLSSSSPSLSSLPSATPDRTYIPAAN